jgi:hypothetical protein
MIATLVLLTPWAALVGLAFLAPIAALALRTHREERLRRRLDLTSPGWTRTAARLAGLVAVAILVALAAAQPVVRNAGGEAMRTDAEMYLTLDVSRSMLAARSPRERTRLERAITFAEGMHRGLPELPTGVATITNRMMPLLFPIPDGRGVSLVLQHSVAIAQPAPARLSAPRATQLGTMTLVANRTYFSRTAKHRALVVLSDFDTDDFGLSGTIAALRRSHIEPFLVRIASHHERVFDDRGRPEPYVSRSTIAVSVLRHAGWHAYEESELARAIGDVRAYVGTGPTRRSGVVESERQLAWVPALAALVLVALLTAPSLLSGVGRTPRRWRGPAPTRRPAA